MVLQPTKCNLIINLNAAKALSRRATDVARGADEVMLRSVRAASQRSLAVK
jgi:hypothetical protein